MFNSRQLVTMISVVFLCAACFGQQGGGTISGTATDPAGALVAGAEIEVRNVATNSVFRTTTNNTGFYTVPGISVGEYAVTAVVQGFKRSVRSGIRLQVDQKAVVDFRLELGAVAESVEVVGQAALVDTSSSTLGKVVENRRVQELPLNGRNTLALTLLTPGVRSNAASSSGFGDRGVEVTSVSINNGPTAMNGQVLDGGNNIQTYLGDINMNPAVDAVEEFKVQTNTMSAEFGFTAGGVVNLATKSGANALHGTAYEFLRNDKFDARNAFAADKGRFRYHQFGASLGGPVIRDKTFFFGNFEEWRFRKAIPRIVTFATLKQRQGDFSDQFNTSGRLIPLHDPATTAANPAGSGFVRQAFAGNLIPASRLDPVSLNVQKFYPEPNRAPSDPFTNSNNYQRNVDEQRSSRQFTFKADHRFSDRNAGFFRYGRYRHYTDGGAANVAGAVYPDPVVAKRDDTLSNQNFLLSDTHTFSPALLNEIRLGVTRSSFPFQVRSFGKDLPRQLGLPPIVPGDTMPYFTNGTPAFNTGTAGLRGATSWQIFNMMSHIRGGHTMKFGVEHRVNRGNNFQRSNPSGNFSFNANLTANPQSPSGTGSAYGSFLLGEVASANVTRHVGAAFHGYSTSLFFNDDWRVSRRLTVNLGLRYDYQQQPVERWNGMSSIDLAAEIPGTGLMGRTVFAGVDGQPRSFRKTDTNDFGPRVGLAYDLSGSGRSVFRAGLAAFYPSIFNSNFFGNPAGFSTTQTDYTSAGGSNFRAFRLRDGFPSAPIEPLGPALGPAAFLGQGVSMEEADGTTPVSIQWNASLQQQFGKTWLVDVSYSANRGFDFIASGYDVNQLDPQYNPLGLALQNSVPNPYAGKVPGSLGGATITREQSLRPYPYYQGVSVRSPRYGAFISHLMLVSVEKRMSQGFTMLFSYTAGKLITGGNMSEVISFAAESAPSAGFQNGKFDRAADRSLDPRDVSQRAVVSVLYELPFGAGKRWSFDNPVVSRLAGGWQINTIGTMQTGRPLSVTGANNFRANRPNSTGQSAKLDNPTVSRWFDTMQFVNPPNFTYGNLGRMLPDVREPGIVNWDLSLIKNTSITERVSLQFRAESFNFMNHVNLGRPATGFSAGPTGFNQSGSFGVITSADDARIVQFGLKLIF
ncbi:MAG: carboxypeptidase regulatory-like domain-containing protein [Bryobacterales bacterium]|nr:carboxypeptidase regulatory-like domain-containing protein [Bryobacterales bacterium]